ncbi:MAG: response regulator [Marvinbryantia sp.]|uniref:response regulator n=1 Tax=Marvinbryantia sp. TaxID=2496532 RepID=UPI00399B15EC
MRIVLAEDEKKTRNGILHMIQQYTAHKVVGVAENGEEGYEIVRREKPDLLISDIKMPVLDGLEMLEKLHKEKLQVNTILLTGYSDWEKSRVNAKKIK